MVRAAVIQPPLLLSREFIDYPVFAGMGAVQAAAVLRQAGLEVTVVDGLCGPGAQLSPLAETAWLGQPEELFLARLKELDQELVILAASPFLLGAPGRGWLRRLAGHLTSSLDRPWVLAELYVGGMHYLDAPATDLEGDPLVLRYEGEPSLKRLAARVARGETIPGGEVWAHGEPFPLDDLPAPAWDLVDAEATFAAVRRVLGSPWRPGPMPPEPRRTLPLVTSRGCPYGCIFCTRNPGLEDRRAVRSVPLSRVERWVARWVDELGLQRLVILDEVANLDRARFDGLLAMVARHGLSVELPNGLRADRLTRQQVQALAPLTSGLAVSQESASQRVQAEVLGKNLAPGAVERVARWCQEEGLPLSVHYLIGIPGETRAELSQTLEMAARLMEQYGARPLVQNATPLPGTELYQRCQDQGLLVDHRPEELWAAFQGRGIVRTEAFDPQLLDLARRALQRRLAPAEPKVIVNLTYRCNNRCVFCAVGHREAQDAETDRVLDALARYRRRGYRLLDIDGGEPTLHEDLLRVVSAALDLGYQRVALITNGRRLAYGAYAEAVARSGLHEVLVSLHAADPDLAGELTGVADAFQQTVAGLRNILAAMPQDRVAVNTTVTAANAGALEPLAGLLDELGLTRWNLQLITPFGRAGEEQLPSPEQLEHHLGRLLERTADMRLRTQLINCPPCLVPGQEDAAAADLSGKAHRDMVFVGAEGENLGEYLATRRQRTARCEGCVHALICAGEYVF